MDNKKENEMELIQRGLEDFLEKELDQIRKEGHTGQNNTSMTGQGTGRQHVPSDSVHIMGHDSGFQGEAPDQRESYSGRPPYAKWKSGQRVEERERGAYPEAEEVPEYTEDSTASGSGGKAGISVPSYQREEGDESRVYDWDSPAPHRRPPERGRTGQSVREEEYTAQTRSPSDEPYREHPRSQRRETRYYEEDSRDERQNRVGEQPRRQKSANRQKRTQEDDQMEKKSRQSPKHQKKKRKRKHRLLKFLIAVSLIFALLGVGLYHLAGVIYGKMTYHEIPSLAGAPMKEEGVTNILLIGNDSRENGEDGRSDAMILLSVSSRTKKIYMTSLLRDMYVDIPGYEGNRLNAAYSYGGAELLMETIEKNLDIPVNRYVLVNFEAFANLIDAVGGIELELSGEEIEYVNGYLVEYNILTNRPQGTDNMDTSAGGGLVHLNGPQALAYSRNRYLGTDFGRTDRQRKVLTAVIGKLPSAVVTNFGGLMDGLMPNLTTNLTKNECVSLGLMAGKLLTYDIESDSIPQQGTFQDVNIRGMEVLQVDFDTNIRYLKEKLYGE